MIREWLIAVVDVLWFNIDKRGIVTQKKSNNGSTWGLMTILTNDMKCVLLVIVVVVDNGDENCDTWKVWKVVYNLNDQLLGVFWDQLWLMISI